MVKYTRPWLLFFALDLVEGVRLLTSDAHESGVNVDHETTPALVDPTKSDTGALPLVCQILKSKLGSSDILCGEEVSEYAWDTYNEMCTKYKPAAIVMITEAAQVQQAVALAHEYSLPISIRGVGHTYNCNSMKNGALMLDMRFMGKAVNYWEDADGTVYARLAPGASFIDMYENIPQDKYSFTHGTCPTVGAYGYSLHGGWGLETSTWANESIRELQVVVASGSLLTLDASSRGSEAALFRAMRVAASSFGIVTSMTIQLFNHPQRPTKFYLVDNSFEELTAVMTNPDTFHLPFGWIGIARWNQFFLTPDGKPQGWYLQALLDDDTAYAHRTFAEWVDKTGIKITGELAQPNWRMMAPGSWNPENKGAFPDSSTFSRLYEFSEFADAAILLLDFYRAHVDACRIQVGPLKRYEMRPIVTLECTVPESIAALKAFVDENADVLKPDKPGSGYVNLPLDASRKYNRAYFPQYEELSAIKSEWDPCDFFYIENGIHPPAGAC